MKKLPVEWESLNKRGKEVEESRMFLAEMPFRSRKEQGLSSKLPNEAFNFATCS
jgi:hypothetical protein